MRKRWLALLLAVAALPVAAAFTPVGKMTFYGARAWLSSKAHFTQCTPDPRIWCEPGAEAFGAAVAPLLPGAIVHDERAFGMAYTLPVRVNVYASDESFARYGAVAPIAAGVVVLGDVHLAPKMLDWPADRTAAILTHELAHLHLVQRIGHAGIGRLPNWFWEGLPTYLSGGGGAGDVTRANAVFAFVHGRHMVPEDGGSLLAPKQAGSYRLAPGMYYRQAAVLVEWLDRKDPVAFQRLLAALGKGAPFAEALSAAYGRPLAALWPEFQQAMQRELLNTPNDSA
ncbi:MAG: putative lipoprotein [Pseudoduganella sp.]|jgi:hypothetical protein|nr:putative lipoprotein [Pseudoduganella sp.]